MFTWYFSKSSFLQKHSSGFIIVWNTSADIDVNSDLFRLLVFVVFKELFGLYKSALSTSANILLMYWHL